MAALSRGFLVSTPSRKTPSSAPQGMEAMVSPTSSTEWEWRATMAMASSTMPQTTVATCTEGPEPRYHVEMFQSILPPEPPVAPARLAEETLLALHGQDYAVRGVMELDLIYSGAAIGKKGERNSCAAIAMAVDAESGIVLAPEVADSSIAAGDTVAKVFLKAIQDSRTLPKEVRVRSQKLKDCLTPLMESLGVAVRVAGKLPASDEARSHLLGFFRGEFGSR